MTSPRIPMLISPFQEALPAMEGLGQNIAQMINPHLQQQLMLKQELAKNPDMAQKLIDMEAANPGTIGRLFGNNAVPLGQGTPSAAAQQEMYNRGAMKRNTKDVAGEGTLQSQSAVRSATGSNVPNLSREQSAATVAGNQAEASDIAQPGVIAATKDKVAEAEKAYELNTGVALANEAHAKAIQSSVDIAKKAKDQTLISQAEGSYKGKGGLVVALYDNDPSIPDETKSALAADPGYRTRLIEYAGTRRMQQQNDIAYDKMDRADVRANARQHTTMQESTRRSDAELAAHLATGMGHLVKSEDLYNIRSVGLDNDMDKFVSSSPEQQQVMMQQNPALAKLLQVAPTAAQSWSNNQLANKELSEKDYAKFKESYSKQVDALNKFALGGAVSKGRKTPEPSEIQAKIDLINSDPFISIARARGETLPQFSYDPGGLFNWGKGIKMIDPSTKKEVDISKAGEPIKSEKSDAELLQYINAPGFDLAKTLADPNGSADLKARIAALAGKLKKPSK